MQRTVKGIRFVYAVTEMDESGNVSARVEKIEVMETDEKKALKKAIKMVGLFNPLKVEKFEKLYVLDDEIFFQHAREVEGD